MMYLNQAGKGRADSTTTVRQIAIFGLGYIGLPLCERFCGAGSRVVGVDIDAARVDRLLAGADQDTHVSAARLGDMLRSGRFSVTTDADAAAASDVFIVCVPTPLRNDLTPDVEPLETAAALIGRQMRPGALVVCESTTYPGAVEDVLAPAIERSSGLRTGVDFHLAYSPERIDPGNPDADVASIPKLLAGQTDTAYRLAAEIYGAVAPIRRVRDIRTAEAAKALENSFRLVNIALANEFKSSLAALGIDVWEAMAAAATKPFGFMPFEPGPGVGGHCVPIDPLLLSWAAQQAGAASPLISLAARQVASEPCRVAGSVISALEPARGAHVLVCGVAYKRNVADVRETPVRPLMEALMRAGVEVHYHDPLVPHIELDMPSGLATLASLSLEDIDRSYAAIVIAVDHDHMAWDILLDPASMIFDTRNVTARLPIRHDQRVIKL